MSHRSGKRRWELSGQVRNVVMPAGAAQTWNGAYNAHGCHYISVISHILRLLGIDKEHSIVILGLPSIFMRMQPTVSAFPFRCNIVTHAVDMFNNDGLCLTIALVLMRTAAIFRL